MKLTALIPTMHRPIGLARVLISLAKTVPEDSEVYSVVAYEKDDDHASIISMRFGAKAVVCKEERQGNAYAWNTAFAAAPRSDAYLLLSDDAICTPGWYEAAMRGLKLIGGSGLVGLSDHWKPHLKESMFYLMTHDFIVEHHGGVAAVPHYQAWCVDTEAYLRAARVGKYIKVPDGFIEHDWHGDDADADECYRLANSRRKANKALYYQRKAAGFPDDFPAIVTE